MSARLLSSIRCPAIFASAYTKYKRIIMKIHVPSNSIFFFIAVFSLIFIAGCDSNAAEDEAPEVIPSEIFTLPVDLFDQTLSKSAQPGANFTAAALRVWPVSLIITANLVIPSLTTLQALQTEPVFQDGAWQWDSSVTANGQTVQFNLSAVRENGGTEWSMRITSTDLQGNTVLDDFELFTAQTSENGDVGSWQLFYLLNDATQNVLNASYVRDSETEKSIVFSIPETAVLGAGDSVEYEENGDERTFIWQQIAESITHTIIWNAVTLEGSITATNFNGGDEGCWDAALNDVACTSS